LQFFLWTTKSKNFSFARLEMKTPSHSKITSMNSLQFYKEFFLLPNIFFFYDFLKFEELRKIVTHFALTIDTVFVIQF